MAEDDIYEKVHYWGFPFPHTHPDRLYTVGMLRGMRPAHPEDCRVLEIGCGDGLNLVAMAADLPDSQFVGIDRAVNPLARGREVAASVGIDNVVLRPLDILDAPGAGLGEFDYVVAHGILSWVPAPVRTGLMKLAAQSLAPEGIAMISYNALPGCHIRRAARDLMMFHAAGSETPVQSAREIVQFALGWEDRTDQFGAALNKELTRIRRLSLPSLVHDDFAEVWDPFHLYEVAEAAAEVGMDFLGDAEISELRIDRYPDGVEDQLYRLSPDDRVRREQYGDFLAGRAFRQTLLCRAGTEVSDRLVPAGFAELHLSSDLQPDPVGGEWASPVDAALDVLASRYPRTATVLELAPHTDLPPDVLAMELLEGFRHGAIEAHARPPRWTPHVPKRPEASALARYMAQHGEDIPTLDHDNFHVEDPFSRRLITLMDGTRDRSALLDGLLESVGTELIIEIDGVAVEDPAVLGPGFASKMAEELSAFAKVGLVRDPGP